MADRHDDPPRRERKRSRTSAPRPRRSVAPDDFEAGEATIRVSSDDEDATLAESLHDLDGEVTEIAMPLQMDRTHAPPSPDDDDERERGYTPLAMQSLPPKDQDPSYNQRDLAGSASAFDELALEMEASRSQFRNDWHAATTPDRFALISAVMLLVGCFLPWITFPDGSVRLGISMAGVCHLLIAVQTFRRLGADDWGGREFHAADRRRRRRRGGLRLVMYGALSVLVAVLFLLYWGYQRTAAFPVVIRFGVYWTLAWGTGLSYGGLSRFAGAEE